MSKRIFIGDSSVSSDSQYPADGVVTTVNQFLDIVNNKEEILSQFLSHKVKFIIFFKPQNRSGIFNYFTTLEEISEYLAIKRHQPLDYYLQFNTSLSPSCARALSQVSHL